MNIQIEQINHNNIHITRTKKKSVPGSTESQMDRTAPLTSFAHFRMTSGILGKKIMNIYVQLRFDFSVTLLNASVAKNICIFLFVLNFNQNDMNILYVRRHQLHLETNNTS